MSYQSGVLCKHLILQFNFSTRLYLLNGQDSGQTNMDTFAMNTFTSTLMCKLREWLHHITVASLGLELYREFLSPSANQGNFFF